MRADRPDADHELLDALDVPAPGLDQIFLVDVVGGDADLREVVEQVVEQDLDRRHRQEGQEEAAAHHAEHVAEIGAGAHLDVLDDVAEDLAALDDAVLEHEEALLQQDDVGGLLGHVHCGVHGDAHVGRVFIAGASLMPSPMKPTTCPAFRSASTSLSFCEGVSLAKRSWSCAACAKAASSIASSSRPVMTFVSAKPTSRQTFAVTSSLSPVRTLDRTPCEASEASAFAAESLGGSRKAR